MAKQIADATGPVVLSLCDRTGNMVRPFAERGWECVCVDTQHSIRKDRTEGNITYTWGDVRSWCPPRQIASRIAILFAFPPCTHMAVSGARDFRKKRNVLLRDSLELFSACEMVASYADVPYMIENPVGKFSDHMGKPDHIFQPWEYGDNYTKNTCLWTSEDFIMPTPSVKTMPKDCKSIMWELPPSDDRQNLRAVTPMGFAQAVFEANAPEILKKLRKSS